MKISQGEMRDAMARKVNEARHEKVWRGDACGCHAQDAEVLRGLEDMLPPSEEED